VSVYEFCRRHQIDLSTLDQTARFDYVERLSDLLMDEISAVVPILPVALAAEIVLDNQSEWQSELEIKTRAVARIEALEARGAPIKIPANTCEAVLSAALTMLEGRGFIESRDGLYRARQGALDLLGYYANSIAHWRERQAVEDVIGERHPPVPG